VFCEESTCTVGIKRLREQDPRSFLRDRIISTASDRRQQAACRHQRRRATHRTTKD